MTQKATSKPSKPSMPSKKQVDAVRTALLGDHPDEITRAWYVQRALADVDAGVVPAVADSVLSEAPDGLTKAWLGTLGGGDRTASAHALAEAAAEVKGGRSFVTELLSGAVAHVADETVLMRAIQNLLIGRPYAPMFLERGIAIARTHAPEVARVLEERAAFVQRNAELLADLRPGALEKKQTAAVAALKSYTGPDRPQLVTWVLSEPGIKTEARRWARVAGFADPAVESDWIAWALNDGSGIYDDEERELRTACDAGGPAALERATNMLVLAIERSLLNAMEHLAEAAPKAFGTPRGFEAVVTALQASDGRTSRICNDMRVISGVGKAFSDEQAQRVVEVLLACDPARLHHEIGRGFFYLYHPGAVPALARAFDGTLTTQQRKWLIDCVAHAGGTAAEELLIERALRDHDNTRDYVFAVTQGPGQSRFAYILDEVDRKRTIHAVWMAVAAQVHWVHKPRAVLEIVERVSPWLGSVESEPKKLAMIYGTAVRCALELHRYELAKRYHAVLSELPETAIDPTEGEIPALVPKLAPSIEKLFSGELEAELAKIREEAAAARAAGTPLKADDDRIGRLAGCRVRQRIHDDRDTGEVWFFDAEGNYGYYDGYDLAPVDWWICEQGAEWAISPRLAAFAADWRTEERTLCIAPGAYREILRSGDKLFGKVYRADPMISAHTFAVQLPSVERAREVIASMAKIPMLGAKLSDPFYAEGKRDGGAIVREIHGRPDATYLWKLGREVGNTTRKYKKETTVMASDDEALAAFEAIETAAIQRGVCMWKLEVDGDRRPASEQPLAKWIDERYRNDSEPPAWHLEALPAIRDAVAISLPVDGIEVDVLPPASEADLAAYEATLPTPLPDKLRDMWRAHAGASWRVGKVGERVLSPAEVLAGRTQMRDTLRASVKKLAPKLADVWEYDFIDVLAVDATGHPTLAFDIRQQREACYAECTPDALKRHDWWDSLAWMIAVGPNHRFVRALTEKHPTIKKLRFGEIPGAARSKPKAKPKGKSKPAAKAAPAKKKAAKSKK